MPALMVLQSPAWKPPHAPVAPVGAHIDKSGFYVYLQWTLKLKYSAEGLLHGMTSFFGRPPPPLLQTVGRI